MSSHSADNFAVTLSRLRLERCLSYGQLAYRTGLSKGYLNHLSKGARPVPPEEVIKRIAVALHVEPETFLEYRLRRVVTALEVSPDLLSIVYANLYDAEQAEPMAHTEAA